MLEEALVLDAGGVPIRHQGKTSSRSWDEVQEFCDRVYMPFRVQPLEKLSKPDATMISARAGSVIFTRFCYGTGIHLDRFDPDAGNILVLNTLRGSLNHHCGAAPATTSAGESFVVDCSRTDYWLDGDPDHLQFNLTIPHDVMEDVAERWFGFVPDDSLWTRRVKFGGPQSRWMILLDYVGRTLSADLPLDPKGALGRHLEELICVDLLTHWAEASNLRLDRNARAAAPYYVRRAEEIMAAEVRDAPTVGDIAARIGVSARTLSEGFRRFRGTSPSTFMAARRLEGFREELTNEPAALSVAEIAAGWGYVNLGALAAAYRTRFGELPSHTRARARRSGGNH